MSERGSFVTEYIYCPKCFEAAKGILLDKDKFLCSTIIPSWIASEELPIIAGKIGDLYSGGELVTFLSEFIPELEKVICHEIRIAVLAEVGQEIFTATPISTSQMEPSVQSP